MSRMALAMLAAFAPAPAVAGQVAADRPLTAEQAMRNYREAFPPTRELDCPRARIPRRSSSARGRRMHPIRTVCP